MHSQAWRNGMCETTVLFHHAKSQTSVRNNWTATNAELSQNRVSKKWERWILILPNSMKFIRMKWAKYCSSRSPKWRWKNNLFWVGPSNLRSNFCLLKLPPLCRLTSFLGRHPCWYGRDKWLLGLSHYICDDYVSYTCHKHTWVVYAYILNISEEPRGKCETPIFICVP